MAGLLGAYLSSFCILCKEVHSVRVILTAGVRVGQTKREKRKHSNKISSNKKKN